MTVIETVSVLALTAWLAASLLGQIEHPACQWVRRWDGFGLIPSWRFFGPNPVRTDAHLLFRDRLPDGTFTLWREVPILQPRRAWRGVWNPGRRQEKALSDAQKSLLRQSTGDRDLSVLQISLPYLLLLNHVADLPRLEEVAATQFALMSTRGECADEEPRFLFLSNLHPLEDEP